MSKMLTMYPSSFFSWTFSVPLDDDLVGAIADGLPLRAVHDHRMLNLRRLAKAAGKQARHQGELGDVLRLVHAGS